MEHDRASWHSRASGDVLKELYTSDKGLSDKNAEEKLVRFGPNELEEKGKKSPFAIFLGQFNSLIVWILILATIVSFIFGDDFEAVLIFVILILNAVFGFWQENKAEKSIDALMKLAALKARVIRDGRELRINARELVPGDIIVLETGDKVPADARLIEAIRLEVNESSLTGESMTVKKGVTPASASAPLAERSCMVYSATVITAGRAKAVVVSTGMRTEIGRIADLVQQAKPKETPLQYKLAQLGEFLGIGTLIICAVVLITEYLKGVPLFQSFEHAISLAVAAIPEGLAAVVTICLALGVQRMVSKNALVRVLPAVETLGSCNVICTDKTGTLTYNQMTVREIFANNTLIDVTGHGYVPEGRFEIGGRQSDTSNIRVLLEIASICNDAKLIKEAGKWGVLGDPTEAALIVVAKKAGIEQADLNKQKPRVDEIPFDSARKCMTTVHETKDNRVAYVKGAPDIIIDKCDRILNDGKLRKLTAKDRELILNKNLAMANKALRVLGFAYRDIKKEDTDIESGLVFVGLIGMIDPPRTEVIGSIRKCREAGIKVVMITGDHIATAKAIGKELGLPIDRVMTGGEIDKNAHLSDIVDDVSIYARVSPQHKMRIISALKSKQYIVAMTGDGVNDAPAMKIADIGVAMGLSGTDVAKEASDMILTDDNFSSIVNAVEEGRGIYDNIRKFVKYLLSSNIGEVLTIFIAALIGFQIPGSLKIIMPLTAIHLLWINLLTDSFPALALGVEPTDPDVMKKPPRKLSEKIISKNDVIDMVIIGIILAIGTLYIFKVSLAVSEVYAVTMAFSTLVIFQLFNVLNCKSEEKSIFRSGIFNNKWLIAAIALSFALQLLAVYAPLMYTAADHAGILPLSMSGIDMSAKLQTTALSLRDWAVIFLLGSTILIFEEVRKFFSRKVMMRQHG